MSTDTITRLMAISIVLAVILKDSVNPLVFMFFIACLLLAGIYYQKG